MKQAKPRWGHEIYKEPRSKTILNANNFHNLTNQHKKNFGWRRLSWDSHVWRHSDMVVASLKSLLQSGHVMHAAIVSLLIFTTWFDISPILSLLSLLSLFNASQPSSKAFTHVPIWCMLAPLRNTWNLRPFPCIYLHSTKHKFYNNHTENYIKNTGVFIVL